MPKDQNQLLENFLHKIFLGFQDTNTNQTTHDLAKISPKSIIEKFNQLYLFAEFGKMTSGLFHDLISPLTALLLQIEELKTQYKHPKKIQLLVDEAFNTTKQLQTFLKNVRKQIQNQEERQKFELGSEIGQALRVLSYRFKKNHIQVRLDLDQTSFIWGNPIRFHQIIINLLSNAIDAYQGTTGPRFIDISLKKKKNIWRLEVCDYGKGIKEKDKKYIFQPLFTTKESWAGIGLGLCLVKYKIEKEFLGTISVKNSKPKGTTFVVELPCNEATRGEK